MLRHSPSLGPHHPVWQGVMSSYSWSTRLCRLRFAIRQSQLQLSGPLSIRQALRRGRGDVGSDVAYAFG
jgi:hypothetical protein